MADKKKSSGTAKKKSSSSKEKGGEEGIHKLEDALKVNNEKLAKSEREIKEKDEEINGIIRLVYSKLQQDKQSDKDKFGKKTLDKVTEIVKEQTGFMDRWLTELTETQHTLQALRLATCKDAENKRKKSGKDKDALVDLSRSQLSQTTLTSVDDSSVDWTQFDVHVDPKQLSPPNWSAPSIGKSAFSTVHKASYRGHQIVVKRLITDKVDPKDLEQYAADFKKLASIRGPSLLAHIGYNFDGPEKIVLLEEAKLGPLNRPGNIASLPFERRVKMTRGLTEALNLLHERTPPVLHLRLTPSNILMTSDFKIKLADYGRPFHLSHEQIMEGGYAPYLSPQRLAGETPSVEDDVYSYGICLAYLFTQEQFLQNTKDFEQVKKHVLQGGRPKLSNETIELPEALETYIKKCFHAERAQRPVLGNVLKREVPWDLWNREMSTKLKGEAADIWNTRRAAMKWKEFQSAWLAKFRMPREESTIKCMKILMDVELDNENAVVLYKNFDLFLKWFGPVNGTTVESVLKFIPTLLQNSTGSWFHGHIDDKTAKERLRLGGETGVLVRLNPYDGKHGEPFLISYRQDKKMFNWGLRFNFTKPAKEQLDAFLKKKNLDKMPMCSTNRDTGKFERAFKAGAVGRGYATASTIHVKVDLNFDDD